MCLDSSKINEFYPVNLRKCAKIRTEIQTARLYGIELPDCAYKQV